MPICDQPRVPHSRDADGSLTADREVDMVRTLKNLYDGQASAQPRWARPRLTSNPVHRLGRFLVSAQPNRHFLRRPQCVRPEMMPICNTKNEFDFEPVQRQILPC